MAGSSHLDLELIERAHMLLMYATAGIGMDAVEYDRRGREWLGLYGEVYGEPE